MPPRRTSVDWPTSSTMLAHAVRGLANARRTAVLQLACNGRTGEIAFERGVVVAARSRRLTGQDAFNHLMMWADVKLSLREERAPVTMRVKTDALLDIALGFCEQLDGGAHVLGGPRSTFSWNPARLAKLANELPAPVRAFAAGVNDGARLADLVEDSTFATGDALKICYRLCELGVLEVKDAATSAPSLASQLAIVDWLLTANAAASSATLKVEPTRKLRRDPSVDTSRTSKTTRTSKTARSSRLSKPFSKHDLSFDDLDKAFFAREVELQRVEETDRFEDLEETATRYKLER